MRCFCLLLSAILLFSRAAWAEPVVTVRTETYPVRGRTLDDLRRDLKLQSAKVIRGRYYARTDWNIRWSFTPVPAPGGYRSASPRVSVDVVYRMPKWVENAGASPELKQRWTRYYEALQLHEDGHRQNGLDAAREVEKVLVLYGPRPDARRLSEAANQAAQRVIAAYKRKDTQYDGRTQHGRTQGAFL